MPVPSMPLAPGRLSMTTCWPRLSASLGAMVRPMMSVTPPAPLGMIMRMGRVGKFSAACNAGVNSAEASSIPNKYFMM
jgi:hypothetical protein